LLKIGEHPLGVNFKPKNEEELKKLAKLKSEKRLREVFSPLTKAS
jgi:hypothetical protein